MVTIYKLRVPLSGLDKFLSQDEYDTLGYTDKYFYDALESSDDIDAEEVSPFVEEDYATSKNNLSECCNQHNDFMDKLRSNLGEHEDETEMGFPWSI